jgi:hypothetical protein
MGLHTGVRRACSITNGARDCIRRSIPYRRELPQLDSCCSEDGGGFGVDAISLIEDHLAYAHLGDLDRAGQTGATSTVC